MKPSSKGTTMERIRRSLGALHHDQSGAIALLLLASILILFMSALVIYDAGTAAGDKMEAQIAADSATFSHTVVKARGMNMMAYANTIKRMIFSYLATYMNAWIAILVLFAYHASRCFRTFPNLSSCWTWAKALPMVIIEGVELVAANNPSMGGKIFPNFSGENARSLVELQALEQYQEYMFAITPWWAYVEGVHRGMTNGALMTATWPVPGESLAGARHIDVLPIERRDRDTRPWRNPAEPYRFNRDPGGGAGSYCMEYASSLEAIIPMAQTLVRSISDPSGWKWAFFVAHMLPSIGCFYAAWSYDDVHYQDWRIKTSIKNNRQNWFSGTAALSVAYTPRAGRNADDGERQKYTYMTREASLSDRYRNEGYFAMARSELVYKQPFEVFGTVANIVGSVPLIGALANRRLGIQHEPDMWSPRYRTKNRPVILPGERFGSSIAAGHVGLDTVARETAPYLTLGSIVGIPGPQGGDPPFDAASAMQDFMYLTTSTSSWNANFLNGVAK